jgi:hypothetical protein
MPREEGRENQIEKRVPIRTFFHVTESGRSLDLALRQTPELRPPSLPSLEFTHLNLNHTNSSPVPQQLLTIPQNA